MQSQFVEDQTLEVTPALLTADSGYAEAPEQVFKAIEPMCFKAHFEDYMELYADAETVANYLNSHQGWFRRCALPMKADPLGDNGYALVIGRFGAFGYDVEPKVGLELLPPSEGVYRIRTIPIPNYVAPGYEVDYKSSMELVELPADELSSNHGSALTQVQWQLDLAVYIQFPKFIYKLQRSLIQKTGDRLLCQIVRQVSRRLTCKVQEDFHKNLGISLPDKSKKRAAAKELKD